MKTLRSLLLFLALWGSAALAQVANVGHAADAGSTAPDAGGTVTSVGLALPASTFTVSGSPVTTSGTLTGAFTTQTANTIFAGPTTGVAATPTWRALVAADIPAAVATIAITDDTTTNATMYPTWVTANTGNLPVKVSSTKLSFNPSTGLLAIAGNVTFGTSGSTLNGTTDAIGITAVGTNQSLTFTPNGTGFVNVPGFPLRATRAGSNQRVQLEGGDSSGIYIRAQSQNSAVKPLIIDATETGTGTPNIQFSLNGTTRSLFNSTGLLLGTTVDSANGILQLASGSTATSGIAFGTRAAEVIYRTGNDALRTDASWTVSGAVTQTAKTTTYNNIATQGTGLVAIVKKTRVTAQGAANASICTYTVPAADATFEVSANMNATAVTTLVTTLSCTYTDESNTARTMIFPVTQLSGSFIALGAITTTGAWETPVMHIRCKASTTITIFTSAGTFTGVTYTAEGIIKQTGD